jgi:hypothetical protein
VLSLCHGSGTDAIAAALEGMDCLGIDSDTTMCQYAQRRIEEFFKAEQKLADACKEGARDYDGLVEYANHLNEAALQAKANKFEALQKILSNAKVAIENDTIFPLQVERGIIWNVLKLYYRFVSDSSERLVVVARCRAATILELTPCAGFRPAGTR